MVIAINQVNHISDREFDYIDLKSGQELEFEHIRGLFTCEIPAVRIRNFLTSDLRRQALGHLEKERVRRKYQGISLTSDLGICSHWDCTYHGTPWAEYFSLVRSAEAARQRIFSNGGDPVKTVARLVSNVTGISVGNLNHPRFGSTMYAGIIRSGVADLHFDWADLDLPGQHVSGQIGWSVYLSNAKRGGNLRVFALDGLSIGDYSELGNYGIPRTNIRSVKSVIVPCNSGDCVMVSSRLLHEVTEKTNPNERVSVAGHLVQTLDGRLRQFS